MDTSHDGGTEASEVREKSQLPHQAGEGAARGKSTSSFHGIVEEFDDDDGHYCEFEEGACASTITFEDISHEEDISEERSDHDEGSIHASFTEMLDSGVLVEEHDIDQPVYAGSPFDTSQESHLPCTPSKKTEIRGVTIEVMTDEEDIPHEHDIPCQEMMDS